MVFIHLRDACSTETRTRLDDVDLTDSIAAIKSKTETKFGISVEEQRLVYMGRILEDCQTLESYGVSEGCTVYILRKTGKSEHNKEIEKTPSRSKLRELSQQVSKNQVCQALVKKILKNPETHERFTAVIPSLKKDPVACALLKEPELFLQILETANFDKIEQDHQGLIHAADYLIMEIKKERYNSRQVMPGNQAAALDANDMEGLDPGLVARAEMIAAQEEVLQQQQDARQQQISPMQLAMALSQAGMTPEPSTAAQSSGQSQSQQNSFPSPSQSPMQSVPSYAPTLQHLPQSFGSPQPAAITSDFFSQAIASAMASTSQASNAVQPSSNQAALQQMRDMGITNDRLSLQALAQTNGDIQAALNLIFEGGLE